MCVGKENINKQKPRNSSEGRESEVRKTNPMKFFFRDSDVMTGTVLKLKEEDITGYILASPTASGVSIQSLERKCILSKKLILIQ